MNINLPKIVNHQNSPVAWWIYLGKHITGNVLAVNLDSESIEILKIISTQIHSARSNLENVPTNNWDAIIINNINDELSDEEISSILDRYLSQQTKAIIYRKNPSQSRHFALFPFTFIYEKLRRVFKKNKRGLFPNYNEIIIPSMSEANLVYESFIQGNYFTNKNTFIRKQKIKELIYNSYLHKYFVNSLICIIGKGVVSIPIIEDIKEQLDMPALSATKDIQLSTILYKRGKALLIFREPFNTNTGFIFVITLSKDAFLQRINEMQIIYQLNKDNFLRRYSSTESYMFHLFEELPIFCMKMQKGQTVDLPNKNLNKMNQNAYKEIKNIAQNTHCIDQQAIALQLQLAFEGMSKRIPSCAEEIENLRIRFQSKLKDLEIPLVFFHGDLKLENFLLDENNCIKSIIDFELSKVRGPIMLDLLYLLAYNRRMVLGERFTSTILFFLDNKFSDIEMEFINDFREEFNISDEVFKILLVIFFVHHFGIRYQVGLSKTESISRFRDALKTVLSLI